MKAKTVLLIITILIFTSACGQTSTSPTATGTEPRTLTIMTHDSFLASESVISAFETANNVKIQFLLSGDAGTALNKAILSKDNPLADVFYGVDNTFLSRALTENIFDAYNSPLLADIPDEYEMDSQNRALPVDWGDVCLNYDQLYLTDRNIQPPLNLEDLLKPEFKDLLVVENPASSSPGLAFLLATIGHFGADKYLEYWQGLVDNNLLVVNDWTTAYYTNFSRWGGDRPIVVSYGSSPPFEVIDSGSADTIPRTAVVTGDGSCFRQIEFVGILRGTKNRNLAERWIDFMLSPTFQENMPLQMYVFPVNSQATMDETFTEYLSIPENPAYVSPDDIAENREQWINDWTETVLR